MEGRTEYPALLATLTPDQAIDVLSGRVGIIKKINSDVADWLAERRKVEEAYVIGLRKLASRPQQEGAAALGIFQVPWQRIVSSTENLAASHEILAQKIETDVEIPLRQFTSRNRELQELNSSQSNISTIAKELSSAQKKAAKGGRKADEASASLDEASRQWEAQAPYVFEQLQALDERRVNNLRDVLTQLQTHEVDQVERNRASAESCLNALLNIDTGDEIRAFAAKAGSGTPSIARRQSSTATGSRPQTSSLQPPAPPPPRLTQDRMVRRESSQDNVPGLPETPQKSSKLGGLKRFGTVMSSKRKSMAPPPPPSEKKKEKRGSLMPFRRGDSSRSFQDLEETGADLNRAPSREPAPSLSQIQTQSTQATSRERLPTQVEETVPTVNGTSNNPFVQSQAQTSPQELPAQQVGLMAPLTPQQPASASPPQSSPSQQFQAPPGPPPSQTDPISRAQQEAESTNSAELDDSTRNFAIRDKPIQEDESEAQLAMSSMANQLRMQAQTSGINRAVGSVRGRRDVRNTMFFPSGVDTSSPALAGASSPPQQVATSPAAELASPIARATAPPRAIPEDHALSDTHSVHSSHSLANLPHHPELHSPGLNASIVETVNTWFSESGITKSFVTGEIALAYNSTTSTSPPESESVRLTQFELLEKVATNPMFVSATKAPSSSTEEQAGTYTVSLSNIRRSTPAVGLKYQLHMDETNLGQYSPLLLTPAWQVIEGQTSVILLYSLNPAFNASTDSADTLTLKNVSISISLDPYSETKAQSAMMSPTAHASFRKRAGAVTWKFPELALHEYQERMLVRFMTPNGTAKKGSVEVKFELAGRCASVVGVERLGSAAKGGSEVDPFADEGIRNSSEEGGGKWEGINTRRVLVSGRYSAS